MIADYFTKPTTSSTFTKLWELVMNTPFPLDSDTRSVSPPQCEDTGDSV